LSTPRPSFRAAAAQRLAEGPAALPAAVEEFLSDTRRMAVRLLPMRVVTLPGGADGATGADGAGADGAGADLSIASLTDSIRAHGVLEPILVRPTESGRYEVVSGRRRLRAALAANLESIPAVVRELDEATAGALAAAQEADRVAAPEVVARPDPVRLAEPFRIGDAPRPRRTTGTYMPPAVVTRREPIVISGPGIPGPGAVRREAEESEPERRVAGDDDRRPRFRFAPFPFLRRPRSGSGEHR